MFDTNSRDNLKKSMRVAAYGHIVSGGNVMRSGYAELVSHFSTIIHNTDGWEYAGVYVDQGFGQTELERLMADGRAGKIDLVIVPNVSVLRKEALLDLVRRLQNLNIDLFFEDENIHTMSEDGEALISVLASFIKPKPEPKPKLLPYGLENEEEAKVVKRIFQMLMAGNGRKPIADTLNAEGVPSPRDVKWAVCDIRRITKEAAYRDTIIDADTFDAAQDVMSERSKAYHYRDPFEGMFAGIITCFMAAIRRSMETAQSMSFLKSSSRVLMDHDTVTCPSSFSRSRSRSTRSDFVVIRISALLPRSCSSSFRVLPNCSSCGL